MPDPTLMSNFLIVLSQQYRFWTSIDYTLARCKPISLVYVNTWMTFNGLSTIITADSAQPRNCSIVTRPFSSWEGWVWARDYSTRGLIMRPFEDRQTTDDYLTPLHVCACGIAKIAGQSYDVSGCFKFFSIELS